MVDVEVVKRHWFLLTFSQNNSEQKMELTGSGALGECSAAPWAVGV